MLSERPSGSGDASQGLRRLAKAANEGAAHAARINEAGTFGDPLERHVTGLDGAPGAVDTQSLDRFRRGGPGVREEGAGEVARAHGGALGEMLDRQWLGEMLAHPVDQVGEAARLPTDVEASRELRLSARPTLVDDQLLRRMTGDVGAEIVLDQRECEVDAGGNTRRRPHIAVAHEDAVEVERDAGIEAREEGGAGPMRRGAPPIQQSRLGQQEGARTDAGDPASLRPLEPCDDGMHGGEGAVDIAPGDDDRVEAAPVERSRRQHRSRRTLRLAPLRRQHHKTIAAGLEPLGDLEGGNRSGDVQQLKARMDDHGDGALHGSFCPIFVISDKCGGG